MKNLAASVHARLTQRRARTGEDYNVLLVRLSLERLLYRLSNSAHGRQFVLKGALLFALLGTGSPPGHTRSGSAGFGNPSRERLTLIFRDVCGVAVEPDGMEFDPASVTTEEIRAQDEYAGIRVKLKARLGQAVIPLQVDVGFGDVLTPGPEEITFPVLLNMAAPRLRAYRRETVVAEKLEAIVELGMLNTRFKDYYDLHFLSQKFPFEGKTLAAAIAATFQRRGTPLPDGLPTGLTPKFSTDPAKIQGWEAFCRKTVPITKVPRFSGIVNTLADFLELPLRAAATQQSTPSTWKSGHWTNPEGSS